MRDLKSILTLSPIKISLGYLTFGVLWIPITDVVLAVIFTSQQMPTLLGLLKGWLFIALSTALIYSLSSLHEHQMSTVQTRLQTANQQLQVLNRVFRHNIRNDLNVIHGYADMVSEEVTEKTAQTRLDTVQETAERVIKISNKLKIVDNVDPTLSSRETVDLVTLLENEIEEVQSMDRNITTTTETLNRALVEGGSSIQYALREVLENAVVHNDTDEVHISVAIERTDGEVELTISDNGPGIPDTELQSIQSGGETPLAHASSVGLWLVEWMCHLHDGDVQFTTPSSDGTTVSFQFQAGTQASLIETEMQIKEKVTAVAK